MKDFLIILIECSVSMSVLILGLLAITPWLIKRYTSKWIYYTWLVVVAALIIPFRIHFKDAAIQINTIPTYVQSIVLGNTKNQVNQSLVDVAAETKVIIPWYQIAGCLWITGIIIYIMYYGLRHLRFMRMVKRWGELANPQILDALQKARNDMNIDKQIVLQICSCISSPMLIGFTKPVILLPSANFKEDELSLILRHELVHYKRKDLWYKSLVLLATTLHWFNPFVYLMAKAIAVQCEISCDAEVVNGTGLERRQQYSEAIISVILHQSKMSTTFSTNFYGGKNYIKKRIYSIMDITKKKSGIFALFLVLLGTAGTGAVFAAAGEGAEDNVAYSISSEGIVDTDTKTDAEAYSYSTEDPVINTR